jgi:hypothetical protein
MRSLIWQRHLDEKDIGIAPPSHPAKELARCCETFEAASAANFQGHSKRSGLNGKFKI